MPLSFKPIAIIGCGPAGAITSIFLSKKNIPHIIFEKEAFPRDKICGDACSGKTSFVLRKADPHFLTELFSDDNNSLPSHGIAFSAPNGKLIDVPFPKSHLIDSQPIGFVSKRLVFDNFLFEKAHSPFATILQQVTITEIDKTTNGYSITLRKLIFFFLATSAFIPMPILASPLAIGKIHKYPGKISFKK